MKVETKPFDRMAGIGGSEIASVLGFNKFKSRQQLFLKKTGRGGEFKGNIYTEQGKKEEDRIAGLYLKKYYPTFKEFSCLKVDTITSQAMPFLYASLDRLVLNKKTKGLDYILEIKTSQISNYESWYNPDIVNAYWFNGGAGYYWQLLHYMIVYTLDMAVLYCQFFDKTEPTDKFFRLTFDAKGVNDKFRILIEQPNGICNEYRSSKDDCAFLIKEATKFWDEVIKWREENERN